MLPVQNLSILKKKHTTFKKPFFFFLRSGEKPRVSGSFRVNQTNFFRVQTIFKIFFRINSKAALCRKIILKIVILKINFADCQKVYTFTKKIMKHFKKAYKNSRRQSKRLDRYRIVRGGLSL